MSRSNNPERGRQILIEGTDGTGKTTVANLVADRLREQGREVIRVDEPDSAKNEEGDILVPIATEVRDILKKRKVGSFSSYERITFYCTKARKLATRNTTGTR